jgi:hypothetical protein
MEVVDNMDRSSSGEKDVDGNSDHNSAVPDFDCDLVEFVKNSSVESVLVGEVNHVEKKDSPFEEVNKVNPFVKLLYIVSSDSSRV